MLAVGAQCLHLHFAIADAVEAVAHLVHFRALRVLHFHHGAAGEFHREIQPAREQKEHGAIQRVTNEINVVNLP